VAGIANPESFFAMLRAPGSRSRTPWPCPTITDFDDGRAFDPAATLLCTEKDAAKLWRCAPTPGPFRCDWTIAPEFWIPSMRCWSAKLSSADGSPTA
jgi:tetraacyldisaccharide 4'-kinase